MMASANDTYGSVLLILLAILIFLGHTSYASSPQGLNDPQKQDIRQFISKTLIGDLWSYDEFCGEKREPNVVSKDNEDLENFFNGTSMRKFISTFNHNNSTSRLASDLSHLNIKARRHWVLTCSYSSWGYANDDLFRTSNSLTRNESECITSIDMLYKYATHQLNPPQIPPSELYKLWEQINNFGSSPEASFVENPVWTGDYNSCVSPGQMRFCFAGYRPKKWPKLNASINEFIRIGVCLPKFCDSQLINQRKDLIFKLDAIIKTNIPTRVVEDMVKGQLELTQLFCPPAEDSISRRIFLNGDILSQILLIVALIVWVPSIIFATINNKNGIVQKCFNMRIIWSSFWRREHLKPELAGLNSIKVIGMFWLITTHHFVIFVGYSRSLTEFRYKTMNSLISAWLFQAQHSVPVFFIISGFLIAYKELKNNQEPCKDTKESPVKGSILENIRYYIKFVFGRYARLLPMYLVVYTYVRKFGHLLGNGPFWDHGVSNQSEILQCHRESWLVPVLMSANFINPFSACILTGWHIANDFQIFLILPLVFYVYRRSRRLGNQLAWLGFSVSHLYHVYNFTSEEYSFNQLIREPSLYGSRVLMDRMSYAYTNPFGRFGTFLLGVILADLLIDWQAKIGHNRKGRRRFSESLGLKVKLDSIKESPGDIQKELNVPELVKERRSPGDRVMSKESDCQPSNDHQLQTSETKSDQRFTSIMLAGIYLISGSVMAMIMPVVVKDIPFGKQLGYPICRLSAELGWFLVLYATLMSGSWSMSKTVMSKEVVENWQSGFIPSTFRSTLWNLMAKLNYTLILTHFTIARHLCHSQARLLVFSWFNVMHHSTVYLLMCYSLAFLIHLTVEMPLTSLTKLMTARLLSDL